MDKNTTIGFLLIAAILFGFLWLNEPSKEKLAQQRINDSIASVKAQKEAQIQADKVVKPDSVKKDTSSLNNQIVEKYGAFAPAAVGQEKLYVLENSYIRMTISSKGGQPVSVQLKNYKTNDGKPLFLFDSKKDSTSFGFNLVTENDRIINTADMYFEALNAEPVNFVQNGKKIFTFRLKTTGEGYLDYTYTLSANDYMVNFNVKPSQLDKVLPMTSGSVEMQWKSKIKQQEKSKKFESRYAYLTYKYIGEDMEKLSEGKDENADLTTKVKWIGFKDQFFSSVLIADESMTSAKVSSKVIEDKTNPYLKTYKADMIVPFDITGKKQSGFRFYFGPNKFEILESYGNNTSGDQELKLQKLVPLGWSLFPWINRWLVIPVFNFLSSYIGNFGIIILLLTIFIKLLIFPLTYKSFLSTAKMRVLKPQLDEIHSKIPASKPQERQKAQMDLYRKVGVNPLRGCIPMLLQMPILFAMFSFFPASIELRQQSFLWAPDLSSYDAVLTWKAQIPFISTYFGNHISLFCLLMTITNLIYTHLNMQTTMETSQQIPGMRFVMYFMPVMFLFFFNEYASGLSYYYFIATLITIIQTMVIRATIDEEKLLHKLHENAKNPKKQKKSGFLARLEEAQRKQLEMQKQRTKRK